MKRASELKVVHSVHEGVQVIVHLEEISPTKEQDYIIGHIVAIPTWRLGRSVLSNRVFHHAKGLKAMHKETRPPVWQQDVTFNITSHHARHRNLIL